MNMHKSTIEVHASMAAGGGEIRNIDLSQSLSAAAFAKIEKAFFTPGVLVFRSQRLSAQPQIAFTSRFGELDRAC